MEDNSAEELVFSANFACPVCGYSMSELEPRLFSFNNPAGACPTCDGLGVQQFFDPDRVVQNPNLSLGGGAIRGWDRRNFYYYQMLMSRRIIISLILNLRIQSYRPKFRK